MTSVLGWRPPGWTYWLYFALWTEWTCRPPKSHSGLSGNYSNWIADYAEALWALDQRPGSFNVKAMVRDTLAALDHLPAAVARFRQNLAPRAHPRLENLEASVREKLSPKEAYNQVPGRDPQVSSKTHP